MISGAKYNIIDIIYIYSVFTSIYRNNFKKFKEHKISLN